MKPSAIKRLGLTYDALRQFNDRIVCVALTGFGLDGGDDPAFDYVIQAATGVAAMTGHPDGPPTLPGYSSADNSTGLAAALGLLAQIVSGRGGQVDVSLRDVMLSQLNYRASAYLNDGAEPQRYPFGAHSYYVPAQLFSTADGYLALFITHDAFWKSFASGGRNRGLHDDGRAGGAPRRGARRRRRCAGHGHREGLGGADYVPWAYRPPPCARCLTPWRRRPKSSSPQGIFGWSAARSTSRVRPRIPAAAASRRARRGAVASVVVVTLIDSVSGTAWQVSMYPVFDLVLFEGVVATHRRSAVGELGHARAAVAGLTGERRRQTGAPGALQQRLVRHPGALTPSCDRARSSLARRLGGRARHRFCRHQASPGTSILTIREYHSRK